MVRKFDIKIHIPWYSQLILFLFGNLVLFSFRVFDEEIGKVKFKSLRMWAFEGLDKISGSIHGAYEMGFKDTLAMEKYLREIESEETK